MPSSRLTLTDEPINTNGHRSFGYEVIDEALESSNGLLIYQENFMELIAAITGTTFGGADLARRALAKFDGSQKAKEKIEELKSLYFEGCEKHDIDKKTANRLWDELLAQALYSFNKSHAAAYAITAYNTMWYKYYYPNHFYAAYLNAHSGNKLRLQDVIMDLVANNVPVVLPDINVSSGKWESDGSKVYAPLNSVVGISSQEKIDELISLRPFNSFNEFNKRVPRKLVNIRVRRGLYYLGAFNDLVGDPNDIGLSDGDIEFKMSLSNYKASQAYMSVTIPTEGQMKLIEKCRDDEKKVAGFVMAVDKLEDNEYYQDRVLLKLSPFSKVRQHSKTTIKQANKIEKGDFIYATGLSKGKYARTITVLDG